MLNVVLLGGPGIDTSSLAESLAAATGLLAISLGNVMREQVRDQTPLGGEIGQYLDRGDLLPDELVVRLAAGSLSKADSGWALVNFPRSIAQAELLEEHGYRPEVVAELSLGDHEIAVRLRRTCSCCRTSLHVYYRLPKEPGACDLCGGKLALPEDVISGQIQDYRKHSVALADYYRARGKFQQVSALGDFEDVAERLHAALVR